MNNISRHPFVFISVFFLILSMPEKKYLQVTQINSVKQYAMLADTIIDTKVICQNDDESNAICRHKTAGANQKNNDTLDLNKRKRQTRESTTNNYCNTASPFCTDYEYSFPAGVNADNAESGPNYGCLDTQPNPAWYYMEVLDPGDIIIFMITEPSRDIDFALWGPFDDHITPCTDDLTADCTNCPDNTTHPDFYPSGNLVDCSYDPNWNETAHIYGAQTGEIYILLITNYSNEHCNIIFSQINAGEPGAGSANCDILAPPVDSNSPLCEGETLYLTAMDGPTGCTYFWTGPAGFTSTEQNPVIHNVMLPNAGEYSLKVIFETDTSDVVTTQVDIYQIPTSTFVADKDTVLIGEEVTFTYTGSASASADYYWVFEEGILESGSNQGPCVVHWTLQGDYDVSLVVEENNCTSDSSHKQIHVAYPYSQPLVTTLEASAISPSSANIGGEVTHDGGLEVTDRGFNWGSEPDVISNGTQLPAGTGLGTFSLELESLNPTATYYFVAYAVNDEGMAYGEEKQFTTLSEPPAVITGDASEITFSSATISGKVIFDGGANVTERGFYYCVNPNPESTGNKIFEGEGTGQFSSLLTHLNPSTKYYYKAFASNVSGTEHGAVESFVTENESVFIPNAFMPNSHIQANQIFKPELAASPIAYSLEVFNFWGEKLFSSNDVNIGWDGTVRNSDAPQGTYLYKISYINLAGEEQEFRGAFMLIR